MAGVSRKLWHDLVLAPAVVMSVAMGSVGCTTLSTVPEKSAATSSPRPTPVPSPLTTSARIFTPVIAGTIAPDLTVDQKVEGTCFGNSSKVQRADAWRCSSGNMIIDPCFSGTSGGPLACSSTPWTKSVTQLTLTRPLPAPFVTRATSTDGSAFAIELANGQRCSLIGGATGSIAGRRINYGCPGGTGLGDIDRSAGLWSIYYVVTGESTAQAVGVAIAWF